MVAAMCAVPAFAQEIPSELYLVGGFNNWTLPTADNFDLEKYSVKESETEAGHFITTLKDLEAGDIYLDIFDAKTDWNDQEHIFGLTTDTRGPGLWDGKATTIEFQAGSAEKSVNGINVCNFLGGDLTIDIDWNAKTVSYTGSAQPVENPEKLYLIGGPNNWTDTPEIPLTYNEETKKYETTYNFAAGALEFKIMTTPEIEWSSRTTYFGVGTWIGDDTLYKENPSISGYIGQASSGNFADKNWQGGDVKIEIDWANWAFSISADPSILGEKPEPPTPAEGLFVVGGCNGWNIDISTMVLAEVAPQRYTGTFDIAAGQASFRFYTELGNWGDNGSLPSIGAKANDGDNLTISLAEDATYEGQCVFGKGNWEDPTWAGGTIKMDVDLNSMTVAFTVIGAGVDGVAADSAISIDGETVSAEGSAIEVYDASGRLSATGNGSVSLASLPAGLYIVRAAGETVKVMR